jgi:hypothetical protein
MLVDTSPFGNHLEQCGIIYASSILVARSNPLAESHFAGD